MPEALIRPELVQLGAAPADKTAAIRQAGQLLVAAGCIAPAYVQSLLAREQTANTYLGSGVAIPHGQIADRHLIERTGIAVLQVPGGVEWNAGQRATLIFAIAAQSDKHLALSTRVIWFVEVSFAETSEESSILRDTPLFTPSRRTSARRSNVAVEPTFTGVLSPETKILSAVTVALPTALPF